MSNSTYIELEEDDYTRKDENPEYIPVRESKRRREEYMQSEPQEEKTAPEVEQPEKQAVDLISEERLKEILNILLPWGYSHYEGNKYTGVSPYIGSERNIITIIANDPEGWGSVFAICMDRFAEDADENNSLGYYKGIMKVIAPELVSYKDKFKGGFNVLDFDWAEDEVKDNRFPAKVEYRNELTSI